MAHLQPLNGPEIRLLRIRPGLWADHIDCDLEVVSLRDKPLYAAVSYSWGDLDDTVPILVGGQYENVTRSLFTFLRRIRSFLAPNGDCQSRKEPEGLLGYTNLTDFRLWVDGLCIDQTNTKEKELQIPRMAPIFRRAHKVYAWLGENQNGLDDDDKIRRALSCMHWSKSTHPLNTMGMSKFEELAVTFLSLFQRTWFSRIWVVQEAALASGEPVVIAGSVVCRLADLFTARTIMSYETRDIHLGEAQIVAQSIKNPRHATRYSSSERNTVDNLNELLRHFDARYQASIPHDMLYGLLGLAKTPGSGIPAQLRPDYAQEFPLVCWHYAAALIGATGDPSCIMRTSGSLPYAPSWVPDFRCPLSQSKARLPTTDLGAKVSKDGLRLTIRGGRRSIVTKVYNPTFKASYTDHTALSTNLRRISMFLLSLGSAVEDSPYWVAEKNPMTFKQWASAGTSEEAFSGDFELLKEYYEGLIHSNPGTDFESDYNPMYSAYLARMSNRTWLASGGRLVHFYRTDAEVHEGDVIISIGNASRALVLRSSLVKRGSFTYLGDGAWDDRDHLNNETNIEERDFEIL